MGTPSETISHYIMAGSEGNRFLDKSLFAPDHGSEEVTKPRELLDLHDPVWDNHVETVTETVMLDRTPALALDYVYNIDLPPEAGSDDLSELGQDLENSNLAERALCRLVLGPLMINVTQGCVARMTTVHDLVQDYDYVPYVDPPPPPGPDNLNLPTKEEVENLENNAPVRVYRQCLYISCMTKT